MSKVVVSFKDLVELGLTVRYKPNASFIKLKKRNDIEEVEHLRTFLSEISRKPVLVIAFDESNLDTWKQLLNVAEPLISNKKFIFEREFNVKRLKASFMETNPIEVEEISQDDKLIEALVDMDVMEYGKTDIESFGVFPRNVTIWYNSGDLSLLCHNISVNATGKNNKQV